MWVWLGSDNGLSALSITAGAGIKQDLCGTLPPDAMLREPHILLAATSLMCKQTIAAWDYQRWIY